jgi:hypothetical protein
MYTAAGRSVPGNLKTKDGCIPGLGWFAPDDVPIVKAFKA